MEGREEDAEGGRREQVRCDGESGLAHHPQELTSSSGSISPPSDKRSYPMVAAGAGGGGGGGQEEQRNMASPSRVYAGITTTAIGSLAAKSVNVSPTPSPAKAPSPRDGLFAVDEHKVGLDAAGNGTSSSSTHSPSKTTTTTTTTTASSQASPAPAYSALPGAPPPPSSAPARPVLMQDDSDPDKKDIPAHTIEISPGPQQESVPHSTKSHRFRLPLSMRPSKHNRRRRRRLFREPITTITSSIMPGRKHRAIGNSNTANNASITTGTSSAAGLLAVPGHPGHSRSLPDDDATGHSLTEYPSKTSASSPPHTPAIDAESGINDVRGTNGLLKRVHGSWSLIGLCMANIGPVPGGFPSRSWDICI